MGITTNRMTFVAICLLVGGAFARDMHLLRKLLGDEGAAVSQSATEPTHTKAMPTPAERIGNQRRDSRKCGVVDTHPEQTRAPKEIVEREEILARRQAQKEELTLPGLSYDDYRRSDRGRSEQLEKMEAEIIALEETLAATRNPSKSTQDRLCSLKARRQELTMPVCGGVDRTFTCVYCNKEFSTAGNPYIDGHINCGCGVGRKSTQVPSVQDRGMFSSTKNYTDIELGFSAKMDDAQYKKCLLDELKGTYTLSGGPSTGTGYTYTNQHGAFIQIDDTDADAVAQQCENCGIRGDDESRNDACSLRSTDFEPESDGLMPHKWVDTDYYVETSGEWVIYTKKGVKHFYTSNGNYRNPPKRGWYAVDYDEVDPTHTPTEFRADQNNTVARFLELKGRDLASSEEYYSSEVESSSEQQGGWFW